MDQLPPAARGRSRVRRLARVASLGFIPLAATTLLTTCSDTPTAPNRPGFGSLAVEGILPSLQLPPNLTLDHVHLVVQRRPDINLLDKTYPFDITSQQLTISAQLLLQATAESLIVKIDYLSQTTILFSGTDTLLVHQGPPGTNPSVQIQTAYVGPGTNVAAITIEPRDTVLTFGDDLLFRVTGIDAEQLPVTSFYVTWTSSDPQQIVDGAGSLHAAAKRGVVTITATTPGTATAPEGVTDHTTITIIPAATSLDLSAGDNQTGSVGTQLEQQLAVLVKGADNLPVPGTVVSFAAKTGGGSIDSLTATSDLNGIARSDATLGPSTGSQTFIARLGTLDSVTFTATANGIITSQPVPLVAGLNHSCALTSGGITICWGDNSKGQVGDGSNLSQPSPRAVAGGNVFVSLAAGGAHSCGITASGQAFCWGDNSAAQLGDGGTTPSLAPKAVSGALSFSQIAAGTNYTCGLTTTGEAYCWGSNAHGNLGDGGITPRNVPTAVSGGLSFATITVGGDNHTCALTFGGQAYCWGQNLDGELGDGSTTDRPVPTAVAGGRTFLSISAGDFHTCAITLAGAAICWGDNDARQLGDGSIVDQPNPVAVQGGGSFTAVSAGGNHTCAYTTAGQAFCWGANGEGQIGDDGTTTALRPTQVTGGLNFNAIAAGGNHSCGRDFSGALYCWGENDNAELGDGTTTNRSAPVAVLQGGGVAASIAINQGDGLTGTTGGTISPVPCAVVTDANGLPVQGVTVTFAVASGNGALTVPTAVSDAGGIACVGSWTLGPLPGSNTLTATASGTGISGNPLTFTATALVAGLRTWTGAQSTLWTTAGNWFPATVPGLTETVVIPFTGITNFPVLNAAGFGNDLTLATGASLTITGASVLTLNGNVDLSGTLTAATGSVHLTGAGTSLRGTLNASGTTISGSYALNGDLASNGALSIAGSSASLALGGNSATIGGAFATSAGGVLIMNNPASTMSVAGLVGFGGGDETGNLTAGTLTVRAGFDQTGPVATSFVASGTHHTVLQNLNGQQTITFANPGPSGFGTLQVLTTFGVHLGSDVSAASDVTVNGAGIGGNLLLDGHSLNVGGDFTISQSGKINMVLAADSLLVSGNAAFGGADENGKMSNGVLQVGGNFSQSGTSTSFTATGGHKTILGAVAARSVGFQNPGASGATSRFQDLDVAGATGSLNLTSDLFVGGQLSSKPSSGTPRLVGSGGVRTVTAVGVDATSLVFDNALLVINGGTIDLFDNIGFLNTPATATALTVNNPGRPTPFVFSNLVFGSAPSSGLYLQANDTNAGDEISLTLNLVNPTPTAPGNFVQLLNGAVVNWPGVIPLRTWVGALSTDWFDPGNWSPIGVPGAGEDVSVPSVANQPVLTAAGAVVQNLAGVSGTSLGLAGFDLTVSGDADWQGTMSSSGGEIVLAGGARAISGTFAALAVNGSYSLAGPTVVTGGVSVNSGSIALAGQTLTVGGSLQTLGSGTATMTNAADQLTVAGATTFSGGDETGKLTAGILRLAGSFTVGGAGTAFVASGNHTTIVDGTAAQAINIPFVAAQFQSLQIANTGGGVTFAGSLTAAGPVSVTTATSVTGPGSLTAPSLSTVAGSSFAPAGLNTDASTLTLSGSYGVTTTTFTGGTTVPALAYPNLVINVPATIGLPAAMTVTGNLDVSGGGLSLSGQALSVGGGFQTVNGGTVIMTNAADQLTIAGAATFGGGDETGKLTAGTLRLGGDFSVAGAGTAFVASGTHTSILDGTAAQTITVPFASSRFQNLQVSNTAAPVSLAGSIVAMGQLSAANSAIQINGGGGILSAGGLAVTGLTLNNVLLSLDATTAAPEAFDNVTFQNYATSATQFTVNHPGLATGALTFTNLTFTTQPTTGFYVSANDITGSTGGILSVSLTTSGTPSATLGNSRTQVLNGALVSWGLVGGPPSWNGLLSTDWSNAGNWSSNAVPTAASDVTIPAGAPHQPALTATVNPVNSLAVSSGATLTMSGSQELRVNGDFNQLGNITVTGGTPSVFLLGSGRAAQGSSGASMVVEGSYTLTTALSLSGSADLTVQVAGQLTLNGQFLTVGGDFVTSGSGHLIMTNAADSLVATGASFNSNTPGTISAGTIALSTHLNQTLVGGIGFAATGTNTVVFTGAGPASISFANSNPATGPNFLRHLRSQKTGGAITITGPLRITGDLDMSLGLGGVTGPSHTFVGGAIGLASGNPISLDTLSVGGTLSVTTPADYQVPLLRFVGLAGQTVPTNLFYQNMDFLAAVGLGGGFGMSGKLTIGATVALAGTVTTGQLLIDAGGLLDVNGNTINDGGDLVTQNGGRLKMVSPNDVIVVNGNAVFDGGDETALLTAGTIQLLGNFTQASGGSPASFVASATHLVDLQGTATQTVAFAAPASSRFENLQVSGLGGVDIATQVNVSGTFSITSTATVGGTGPLITPKVNAPNSSNLTVNTLITNGDNLAVAGGYNVPNTQFTAGTTLPSLTYQTVQITVPGTMTVTGTIGFNGNLVIDQGILDVGGKILDIHGNLQTDAGGALKMASPSDSVVVHGQTVFGGASTAGLLTDGVLDVKQDFTQTAGFSPQSFAPSGSHLTAFTGGLPQVIDFVGGAPSGFHDLVISNFAAAVTLNSAVNAFGSVALNSSTLFGGSLTTPELFSGESSTLQVNTLDMTGSDFFVGGPYDVGLTIFGGPTYPDSTILPFAPYKSLQISLPAGHVMFLPGDITVQNDLLIDGGKLSIGASQLTVNGSFTTAGSGVFEMSDLNSRMEVDGKATFSGGSTAGLLTEGSLDLLGDINQLGSNSSESFAASASHLTRVNPATKVFFENPGEAASHFNAVVYSTGGTWTIASSVVMASTFEAFDGTGGVATSAPGSTLTASDMFSGDFTYNGVPLIIEDPFGFGGFLSGLSFVNLSTSVTQLTIHSPGPGFNYSLDNITFTPLTTGDTGLYIDAKDIDGLEPNQLTIEVTSSNESPGAGGNGPTFTITDGVATVSWQ